MSETAARKSMLESRGISRNLGAYVAGTVFTRAQTHAAFALGDGTVRIAALAARDDEWRIIEAHDGAILAISPAASPHGFITGGDDGRLVSCSTDAGARELARFGGKWVEQTASFYDGKGGILAAAAGKFVHLFEPGGARIRSLEHPSTVTGIAFDAKGKRIAASHYNGASLWFTASQTASARQLHWKGSHTAIAIHPAAEAVVTAMQENALHGWRLPDEHDMRMSGYPSKPESLAFTRNGKYLASSGADAVVLWPFFGGGPMGKPPLELAQITEVICTRVACHPTDDVVAAGYQDGSVVLTEIASRRVARVAFGGHGPITALSWSPTGTTLAFGTETGLAALIDLSAPV